MKRWLWAVWGLLLAGWTVALTTTFLVHVKHDVLPVDPYGIPLAKVLHVCAYAFLAGFALLLRPAGAWRWVIVLVLLEHGVATEFAQTFIPERTGEVRDVVIDHCAVALGAALTWPWWRRGRS
jgi:VanZ family protein